MFKTKLLILDFIKAYVQINQKRPMREMKKNKVKIVKIVKNKVKVILVSLKGY